MLEALAEILPENALVVASIDFSHDLDATQTALRDDETLQAIADRSYAKIEGLDSEYLDSPFALIAFLKLVDTHGLEPAFVWGSSSHEVAGEPLAAGTSYFVIFAHSMTSRLHDFTTISFVGDLMLGRAVGDKLDKTPTEQAFSAGREMFAGSDLIFGNLESVLSSTTAQSTAGIPLKADPKRADALTFMGFTHLSVSNNHVSDYGEAAWDESVEHLREAGIAPVGGYRNDTEPVVAEVGDARVVFLAFETLIRPRTLEEITTQVSEAAALGDLLIVSVHWGSEYTHEPSTSQQAWAHAVIDAGADVVVGHHPQVLQGVETYGNGLILYSLGNFIFDQSGEDQNESVIAKIVLSGNERKLDLVPMRIDGFLPRKANEEEAGATLQRFVAWSDIFVGDALLDGELSW